MNVSQNRISAWHHPVAFGGRIVALLCSGPFAYHVVAPLVFQDSDWSETGDRYLLKLFRDFVFHQSRKDGTPIIDWGHIVECLNKVDAGVPENIVLLSRDEKQMLVVSYGDIKKCVETSFEQLKGKAESGRPV
ncbi:unnamed protein product [Ostreobium quekettii]|uniref:Pan3 C-terminal knob domain-containing protein n=1 Tax=Ostreobium quekettii TaxID=121088 RepID=A0A8S1ILN8_9CHLO|nr:unnamed protein product [Ostreobium quekettii]